MNLILFISCFISEQDILILPIILGVWVLIFLALRSVFLWYMKINIIVKNQEDQIRLLNELLIEARKKTGN